MLSKILGVICFAAMAFWPFVLLLWWPINVVAWVYIGVVGTVVLSGAAMNFWFWEEEK